MRSFHALFPLAFIVALASCGAPSGITVSGKTMPDPSPVVFPGEQRGATVFVTFIYTFKDESTGEEKVRLINATGIVVGERKLLTSAALVMTYGEPEKILVAVPDYEARRHKFVTEAETVAKSNSGLLLLETPKDLPPPVTISDDDGPAVDQAVRTVDVLNGSIPGVSHTGTVSLAVKDDRQFGMLLIDVTASRSSIGCGVYGEDGSLVALVLAPTGQGEELNWATVMAISAGDIRAFLDAHGVGYRTAKSAGK